MQDAFPGRPKAHLEGHKVWLVCLDMRGCRARSSISRQAKRRTWINTRERMGVG